MNVKHTFVICLMTVFLVATYTSGADSTLAAISPADVARSAFEILFSGEGDIAPLVCSEVADQVGEMRKGFLAMDQSGAEVDISGLIFTTQNKTFDTAEVVVSGMININISGVQQKAEFPAITIPMVNENGWKVCG